jgi:hypothetical protein
MIKNRQLIADLLSKSAFFYFWKGFSCFSAMLAVFIFGKEFPIFAENRKESVLKLDLA